MIFDSVLCVVRRLNRSRSWIGFVCVGTLVRAQITTSTAVQIQTLAPRASRKNPRKVQLGMQKGS